MCSAKFILKNFSHLLITAHGDTFVQCLHAGYFSQSLHAHFHQANKQVIKSGAIYIYH